MTPEAALQELLATARAVQAHAPAHFLGIEYAKGYVAATTAAADLLAQVLATQPPREETMSPAHARAPLYYRIWTRLVCWAGNVQGYGPYGH